MKRLIREPQPEQSSYTPEGSIETTDQIDELLTAMLEAAGKIGTRQSNDDYYKTLKAFYNDEVQEASIEKEDLIAEALKMYQKRVTQGTKEENILDWQSMVYLDAYKMAQMATLIDDEEDTLEVLVEFASRILESIDELLHHKTMPWIISRSLMALELYNQEWPAKPECLNCIAELKVAEIKIDHAKNVMINEVYEQQNAIKKRFEKVLRLAADAIQIDFEESGLGEQIELDEKAGLYFTWSNIALNYANWLLQADEIQAFVSVVNQVLGNDPKNPEANILMVRHIIENEPNNIPEAIQLLNGLIDLFPEDKEVIFLLSMASFKTGDMQAGHEYMQKLSPESLEALLLRRELH